MQLESLPDFVLNKKRSWPSLYIFFFEEQSEIFPEASDDSY